MKIKYIQHTTNFRDVNKISSKEPDILFVRINIDGVVLSRHKGGKKTTLKEVIMGEK